MTLIVSKSGLRPGRWPPDRLPYNPLAILGIASGSLSDPESRSTSKRWLLCLAVISTFSCCRWRRLVGRGEWTRWTLLGGLNRSTTCSNCPYIRHICCVKLSPCDESSTCNQTNKTFYFLKINRYLTVSHGWGFAAPPESHDFAHHVTRAITVARRVPVRKIWPPFLGGGKAGQS